jgi:CBS domain-containing protein
MDSGNELATRVKVSDIMQTEVVTVGPTTTMRELVRLLAERKIGGTPVVGERGDLVGIITTTDLIRMAAGAADPSLEELFATLMPELSASGDEGFASFLAMDGWGDADSLAPVASADAAASPPSYEEYVVGDIMRTAPLSVKPADSLRDLAKLFLQERIHRAPVVEQGKLVGIVTTFDVLRVLAGDA